MSPYKTRETDRHSHNQWQTNETICTASYADAV